MMKPRPTLSKARLGTSVGEYPGRLCANIRPSNLSRKCAMDMGHFQGGRWFSAVSEYDTLVRH